MEGLGLLLQRASCSKVCSAEGEGPDRPALSLESQKTHRFLQASECIANYGEAACGAQIHAYKVFKKTKTKKREDQHSRYSFLFVWMSGWMKSTLFPLPSLSRLVCPGSCVCVLPALCFLWLSDLTQNNATNHHTALP